jgi:hypothetical protein
MGGALARPALFLTQIFFLQTTEFSWCFTRNCTIVSFMERRHEVGRIWPFCDLNFFFWP